MTQDAVSFFNRTAAAAPSLTTCAVCFSGGVGGLILIYILPVSLQDRNVTLPALGNIFPVSVIHAESMLKTYLAKVDQKYINILSWQMHLQIKDAKPSTLALFGNIELFQFLMIQSGGGMQDA